MTLGNLERAVTGCAIGGLLLVLTLPLGTEAAAVTFTQVADTRTPIPGGRGTFTGFGTIPNFPPGSGLDASGIDRDKVVFFAFGNAGQEGIYSHEDGQLAVIADLNTPIPGGFGSFSALHTYFFVAGGSVVFFGEGAAGQQGIYRYREGAGLEVVVDLDTPIPGGFGTFTSLGEYDDFDAFSPRGFAFDGRHVAFVGRGSGGQVGIYSPACGPLGVCADAGTRLPGRAGRFAEFNRIQGRTFLQLTMDDGALLFSAAGSKGESGIYMRKGARLCAIADDTTPGLSGAAIDSVRLHGETVAFVDFDRGGVYRATCDHIEVVADRNTRVPGRNARFAEFGTVDLDDQNVVFSATGDDLVAGLYAHRSGRIETLADAATPVPGASGTFAALLGAPAGDEVGVTAALENEGELSLGFYLIRDGKLLEIVDESDSIQDTRLASMRGSGGRNARERLFKATAAPGGRFDEAIFLARLDRLE